MFNSLNTLLLFYGFLERGVYDSLHLTFRIKEDKIEMMKDEDINDNIRKIMMIISFIYNTAGRNVYLFGSLTRNHRLVTINRYLNIDDLAHSPILFQIRHLSLIAGLNGSDFIKSIAEYFVKIIKSTKIDVLSSLRRVGGFLERLPVVNDFFGDDYIAGDAWAMAHISRIKSFVDKKQTFIAGSIQNRAYILNLIKDILDKETKRNKS